MSRKAIFISVSLAVIVLLAVVFSVAYYGNSFEAYNYIQININPKVEFVCKGQIVKSAMPLNLEAKEIMAQEQFIDLDITSATRKFVDLATRTGYINLSANNNAVLINCIADYSYALEAKVYASINNFFLSNQILGLIVEADQENKIIMKANELGVSADKFMLIESYLSKYPDKTIEQAKDLSLSLLVKGIKEYHDMQGNPKDNYTKEDLINKSVLIDFNRVHFAKHLEAITNESLKEFKDTYRNNARQLRKEFHHDFGLAYNNWKNTHVNYIG